MKSIRSRYLLVDRRNPGTASPAPIANGIAPHRKPHRFSFGIGSASLHNAYLARLNTASTRAPSVVEGLTYFNSSIVRLVIIRFSSSPSEFGYVLPSTRNMTVLSFSLTEYLPK